MKNKLTLIALLFSFIYSRNISNNEIISNDKRNKGILLNSENKVVSIKDYKRAIDIKRLTHSYQEKGLNATKLEYKGKSNLFSKKNAWKPKSKKNQSLNYSTPEKSLSVQNRSEVHRLNNAQNNENQNNNSIENRNVVTGTIIPLDGGIFEDTLFVYFFDGSKDTAGNFNTFMTYANVDGTYEISVPEGNYYVEAYYNGGGYWFSCLQSGFFTVESDINNTLDMNLYPFSDYAAYIIFEDDYYESEHIDGEVYPVNVYDLSTNELLSSSFTGMLGFNYVYLPTGDYTVEIEGNQNGNDFNFSNEVSVIAGEYEVFIYSFPEYITGSILDEEGRVVDSAYVYIEGYDTSYYELTNQEGNFSVEVEQGEYFVYGVVVSNNDMSYWPATYDDGVVYAIDSSVTLELTLYYTVSYGFVSYYTDMDGINPDSSEQAYVDFYDLQSNENIYSGQTGIFGYNGVSLMPGEYGVQFEGQEMDTLVVEAGQWYDVYTGSDINDDEHNVFGMLTDILSGEGIYGTVFFHNEDDSIYTVETDSSGYFEVTLEEGHWSSFAYTYDSTYFMSIWQGGVFMLEADNDFYLDHFLYPNDYFGFAMVNLSDSTDGLSNHYVEMIGPDYYGGFTNHYGDVCSGLLPGDYTALSEGFQPFDFMVESGSAQYIGLMPYQELDYNVSGHVMTVGGDAVANAYILFQNFNDSYVFASDSNGYYEALIPPNVYSAYAQLDSTHWIELANGVIHIDEGMEQYQDFTLYPVSDYGFLVGLIFGNGPNIAMRSVHIFDEMGEMISELHSNLYGEVAISLLPGEYMMLFETQFGVQEHYVSMEAGMMNVIELMDEPEFPAAHILDIHDVPEDQGGRVYIAFEQSQFDTDGAMDSMRTEMYTIQRMDGEHWVGLTSVGAYNAGVYVVEVTTLTDSTSEFDGLAAYRVLAHMDEGNFISEVAFGYSVDNIAPEMVVGLTGNYIDDMMMLSWDHSQANDMSHYNIYYSTEADFSPNEENLVGSHSENNFNHEMDMINSGDHFYIVSAVDVHENHGEYSEVLTITVLDVDVNLGLPNVFAIHQNYPNPFNPITKINYDLPEDALVSINVFDLMGRSIKTLVSEKISAGFNSTLWDATNDYGESVSAGMYIYTIQAGDFKQTKKMLLLK